MVSFSAQVPLLVCAAVAAPRQYFGAVGAPAILDVHAVRRLVFVSQRTAFDNPQLMRRTRATTGLEHEGVAAIAETLAVLLELTDCGVFKHLIWVVDAIPDQYAAACPG